MKLTLILMLALCVHNVYSQKIDTSTYAKKVDYILQNVDKSSAKTGILYDRAIPHANL